MWIKLVTFFFLASKKSGKKWSNFMVNCEIKKCPNFGVNCEIYEIETDLTQIWPRLRISEKWRKKSEYKSAQLTSSPHFPIIGMWEAKRDEFWWEFFSSPWNLGTFWPVALQTGKKRKISECTCEVDSKHIPGEYSSHFFWNSCNWVRSYAFQLK